jgi:hypothetical protein
VGLTSFALAGAFRSLHGPEASANVGAEPHPDSRAAQSSPLIASLQFMVITFFETKETARKLQEEARNQGKQKGIAVT